MEAAYLVDASKCTAIKPLTEVEEFTIEIAESLLRQGNAAIES